MENLNEVFGEETAMVPVDEAIVVEIVNSANGVSKKYDIYPENTLDEVIDLVRGPLGLGSAGDLNVECNGRTTATLTKTVADMGIVSGSKIIVHPNAKVA